MQTWFFALETGPLTPWQIEQLDASGTAGAVSLSPHPDGVVMAVVEADRITEAFASARTRIDDVIDRRARITALHGELQGSVADVVFRAAESLRIDAAEILLEHLALVWYREALEMASLGARDKQHYDSAGNPKRAMVVKSTPWNGDAASQAMPTWDAIYAAAKGYLAGRPVDGSELRVLTGSGGAQ